MSAERTKRSKVWAHFIKVNKEWAQCNICMKKIASQGGNTSNIMKHLQHTHDIKLKECGVFDCLDTTNARRLPNTSECSARSLPAASVFLSAMLTVRVLYYMSRLYSSTQEEITFSFSIADIYVCYVNPVGDTKQAAATRHTLSREVSTSA